MTSYGSITAFFGDAAAARDAYSNLRRAGFRQIALLSKNSDDASTKADGSSLRSNAARLNVERPASLAPIGAVVGAGLGAVAAHAIGKTHFQNRNWPGETFGSNALYGAGAFVGGALGLTITTALHQELPDRMVSRLQNSVMTGETLVVVRAPSKFLSDALEILRGEGEGAPATFVSRPVSDPIDISKDPLRREVLPLEALREFAEELGASHAKLAPKSENGGAFLLGRLQQNQRIIARVVRGLAEAAKLDQAVSLSAEWLLDNNYVIQGQIKDVERNLSPQFLRELPTLAAGKYRRVPRLYLMASELVSASDSRLDREHLVEYVRSYQSAGGVLSTGELWALPLMLRLAIIENLRRLTAQADARQRERERADFWANRLLAAAFREPDQILPLLAELSREQKTIAPHFADRLVSHLFDQEAALGPVRDWLERKLNAGLREITGREQRRQAADSISVGNCITTLRFLSALDWRECFEQLSLVDAILAQDPAGVYRSMDFDSRDRYRKQVEKMARGAKKSEIEVANLAVRAASDQTRERMRRAAPSHGSREHEALIYQPEGHIGFYLIDEGRSQFANDLGYRVSVPSRARRWVRANPGKWYFGGIGVGTVLALWGLNRFGRAVGGVLPWPLRVLAFLPASEVAIQIVNYAVTRLLPPRPLAKMEFDYGIPERWKTAVVIPMLLGSVKDGTEGAHQLELHYLSNPDPNLRFALLADYVDASAPSLPADEVRLEAARNAIRDLNARHGGEKFTLWIRGRRWSETENVWMGWERKRGKLEEFNRAVLGRGSELPDAMHVTEGDFGALCDTRFIITLDADTQLPYGAARRLIETLAHPLNRPVVGENGLVERGYTLVQPRVDTLLPSAMATRFSRLFSDASGSDPYTHVISDVYQDAWGEGSYHGKGIYDLEVFDRVLGDRFPDATLLSHDLLEGAHVRVGLASDIVLLDRFPPSYLSSAKRDHRWMRGDWQIFDWITNSVPTRNGSARNPLNRLNRWKIVDNLRRSLLAPASVAMLIGGWFGGPSAALAASAGVAGLLLWPTGINVFTRLSTKPESLLHGRHEIRRGLVRAFVDTSLLLHRAGMSLDAIGRVFYRKTISHHLLLEWQTAASTYGGAKTQETSFLLRLASGSGFAGLIAIGLMISNPASLVAASPYLLAWAIAPLVVWRLAGGREERIQKPLDAQDTTYLREISRETWRYFDDFVGPQTNWLPPDNYQESLNVEIAQRTSPTNMGLWLLSCVAAHDFGWLTLDEAVNRNLETLRSFDEMEKYEGHLLNWYDSLTTEPLRPRYVSTVDSGNLLGSLWTLARSVKEISRAPLFNSHPLLGLRDVLGILERALGEDASVFESELGEIRRLLCAEHTAPAEVLRALRDLERPVSALSRALSMRQLVKPASQRSRSNLESAATDPRFTISKPAYWAAQLETQLDSWIQTIARYGRWMEILADPADEWILSLGSDAPDLRRRVLEKSPSLTQLGRGESGVLNELLDRRNRADVPGEVRDWANRIVDEWNRARWFAGEMLASCEDVVDRARGLADGMNMSFLFDAERRLFSIGYNVEERRLDTSYYDLLASECRLASFCSVARGDVPASHWLALGRRFGQTPVGPALMSWSGTMFEYLMPLLFQRAFENSLLERAVQVAVAAQIAYGRRRNVPWGISEAAFSAIDANRTYQYKAFGVPGLGLKRGLEEDLVVAPYATMMALMVDRTASLENLKALEKMGLRGDYGFYESIDFTRERLDEDSLVQTEAGETARAGGRTLGQTGAIVRCFMVHHQGMALLAMQNVLLDWSVQRRFHSDVFVEAAEPLLFEKIPEAPPVLDASTDADIRPTRTDSLPGSVDRPQSPDTPAPRAHLLGSGRYNVMMTAAGAGYTRWHETELTRWRADSTRDNWGQFLYLRDLDTNTSWSATHQPLKRAARRSNIAFKIEKVEFERRDADIESRFEVCVSPEDTCEVRRLTLVNHSNRARRIEATSFAELSLAPHAADRAHPAFNKLFIQTAIVPERDAILAWRRLRKNSEEPVWAAHWMSSHKHADAVQFETDRARFLGRARSTENPIALEGDLSGTAGAVLDPCFALRRRITLAPGERVQIAWVTGASDSEDGLAHMIEKYGDFAACERAFDLAWTNAQLELHHLQIQPDEAQAFQQLAGYMIYPHPALRAPARRVRDNVKGQSGLWSYGISGDLPIMLVAIDNARDLPAVRQALRAHTFWRVRGFKSDLVIVNEQAGGYAQDLTETLKKLIEGSTPYTGTEKPGGVFLRSAETIPAEDMTLLLTVSRVVLVAARGGIAQQLGLVNDDAETTSSTRFVPSTKETSEATLPLPFLELPYFNSLGGFTQDGKEYAIYLGPKDRTPAPWINVFAHEHFGALTSESGQGFAWFGNSQSNRLTPWNNDPVSDTPSEAIYIRDEETGAFWTPTALPIRENEAYRARHGQGYSTFEHNSHGIEQELTTFVPMDNRDRPVRIQRLKLKNRSNRRRKFTVTFYAEWVLGTTREEHQMHVVTSWDTETSTLLARNAYSPDFPSRVAFASSTPKPIAHSGDRTAFLGRNGSPSNPAAMRRKSLTEKTGAGLDPCATLQVLVELGPGEETAVSFHLGEAASVDEAKNIVSGLRDASSIERALVDTKKWWDEMVGTLQVDVPDQSVNYLVNRWLPYQVLSCRIWARSAFYQSGGAWGFRDQLQDSLALTTLYPRAARDQILRSAAHQFEEGDVQHWWHPPGDAGVRTLITDDLLFLPYAVAQYVKVTGDVGILDEEVPFLHADVLAEGEHEKYFQPQISSEKGTIFEHCRRAIEKGATSGPHGLTLIGGGDWNDGLNRVGIEGKGESVWLTWFIIDVLNTFADTCQSRGEDVLAKSYREKALTYAKNIDKNAWDGEYYRRGYFDDGTPLGSAQSEEAKIDSLPQSWAFITGAGDPARAKQAMESLERELILKDEKMVLLFTPAFDKTEKDPGYIKGYLPGVRENGGQYTHAACWVAYAYARAGMGQKAVETLRMLNPVEHARTPDETQRYKVEPYVVAADVYNLEGSVGRGGWTWYTGSCGWMYRVWVEGVLGFHKEGDFLRINPSIPRDWKGFSMTYKHGGASYEIRVENPHGVENGVASIAFDDVLLLEDRIPLKDDGAVHRVTVTLGAGVSSTKEVLMLPGTVEA